MAILTLSLTTSCDDEETAVAKAEINSFPDLHFGFSSFILENGDVLTVTPSIDETKGNWPGMSISSVGYYWDGELVSVEREVPFIWEYEITGQSVGKHNVTFVVYIRDAEDQLYKSPPFTFEVGVVK